MISKSMDAITANMAVPKAAESQPVIAAGPGMDFRDEFEINDYPQVARHKISHRDPQVQIEELTGAKVWVKGQFFADERKMPPGSKKLYVEITGPTALAVQKAKKEVKNMIEALSIRTLNIPGVTSQQIGKPGRY